MTRGPQRLGTALREVGGPSSTGAGAPRLRPYNYRLSKYLSSGPTTPRYGTAGSGRTVEHGRGCTTSPPV
ncbi:hypothetical protein J6590_066121 [Homalodisca vitripennis]|nr:hypothetical protein J6590_066121 [Homalodisca vitripennis]